jgi:hypothetical protein
MSVPFGLIAETLVATPDGPKAIEHILPGDVVWSWNIETGEAGRAEVIATHREHVDHLDEILTASEALRGCTPGTGIYDAFEDMFRAAASLSSLSEMLRWTDGATEVQAVDEVAEHHRAGTLVCHLTLSTGHQAFFADGFLVRHLAAS